MNDKESLLKLADEIEMLPLPRLSTPAGVDVRVLVITRLVRLAEEVRAAVATANALLASPV